MFPKGTDVKFVPTYFICCVGIVANSMLLIAFVKDPLKCFRNSATYLVGNLALSDLVFSVANLTQIDQELKNASFFFLLYFSFYSSMLTIFSIALDRYLMITYPFRHRILMSKGKIAVWIVFVWLLSSIHAIKKALVPSHSDILVRSANGIMLVILTAILYVKTYVALKQQARSMLRITSQVASSKNVTSMKNETNIKKNTRSIDDLIASVEGENGREQNQNERAPIQNESPKCPGNLDESVENEERSVQYLFEHFQNPNERANVQDKGLNSDGEESAGRQNERIETDDEEKNECVHSIQGGERKSNGYFVNNNTTVNITQMCSMPERILSQTPSIKRSKYSQVIQNQKEQRFLNTIIIITCIATMTVTPGSVNDLLARAAGFKNTILTIVAMLMYSLNFAVNPFVYFIRLERYRKTFKLVYGCKR